MSSRQPQQVVAKQRAVAKQYLHRAASNEGYLLLIILTDAPKTGGQWCFAGTSLLALDPPVVALTDGWRLSPNQQ